MKAVVNHYEHSHEIIIPRNCHMIDRSSNERSITVYRLTARKIKNKLPPGHSSQELPHNKLTMPYFKVLNTFLSILGLQPRGKAAMLVVNTIQFCFAEFA